MKTQIQELEEKLTKSNVWIRAERIEHPSYNKDLFIKHIDYYYINKIYDVNSQKRFEFSVRIIRTDTGYLNNTKHTQCSVNILNSSLPFCILDNWKIIDKPGVKVVNSVTKYVNEERKRINDWADSWFNFLKQNTL